MLPVHTARYAWYSHYFRGCRMSHDYGSWMRTCVVLVAWSLKSTHSVSGAKPSSFAVSSVQPLYLLSSGAHVYQQLKVLIVGSIIKQ